MEHNNYRPLKKNKLDEIEFVKWNIISRILNMDYFNKEIIISSLKEIALKSISINLHLNYQICLKNSWKLPNIISDLIFSYVTETNTFSKKMENFFKHKLFTGIKFEFNEKTVQFFSSKVTTIQNIIIEEKSFKKIINFDFLNEHQLDILSINNLKNFSLINCQFSLTSDHLFLNSSVCFNENREVCQVFFSNFLLKNSLHIRNMSNFFFYKNLSKLIENSHLCLKSITFQSCFFPLDSLAYLQDAIGKLKNLEEINFYPLKLNESVQYEFSKFLKNILISTKKTLTKLSLQFNNKQFIYESLTTVLQQLMCLQIISFDFTQSSSNQQEELINTLRMYNSYSLTSINFTFKKLNVSSLVILLRNCQNLKKLNIQCSKQFTGDVKQLVNFFKSSIETLIEFYFEFKYYKFRVFSENYQKYSMEDFSSSIALLDVDSSMEMQILFNLTLELIDHFRDKVKRFQIISYVPTKDLNSAAYAIGYLKKLNVLDLSGNEWSTKNLRIIKNGLKGNCDKISEIKFINCNLNYEKGIELSEIIAECKYLKIVDLSNNHQLNKSLDKIFSSLSSSKDTLNLLNLNNSYVNDNQKFILENNLKYFKNYPENFTLIYVKKHQFVLNDVLQFLDQKCIFSIDIE